MSEALTHPETAEPADTGQPVVWPSAERPDLRRGVWTRLGDGRVLGDGPTEAILGGLAERTRTAAQAQGYAVGWAAGQQAALRRAAEREAAATAEAERREAARAREHALAVVALEEAAAALTAAATEVTARIGEQAADLAFELTRTLVGHELSVTADPGADVVARVLAVLPSGPAVTVRLHPRTAEGVSPDPLGAHGVEVVADPALDPHDAVVETDTTAIDLRISEALDRLREALS
ncbi:FliH/SctL family protein [Nocardioides soli]|uniref:Flagellar assembly protein FliH n=1 Tax=Nocardioides soli TaxID=1036020 RepID=A0A7W4VWD6_9ACTN|nr:FliH/SctL family protein [Nocardioides soli]MBB3043011.1 flagellar assembly protein FliH [Nocardioides soli]